MLPLVTNRGIPQQASDAWPPLTRRLCCICRLHLHLHLHLQVANTKRRRRPAAHPVPAIPQHGSPLHSMVPQVTDKDAEVLSYCTDVRCERFHDEDGDEVC